MFPDFRVFRPLRLPRSPAQWHTEAVVAGHSGASATDSHRLPLQDFIDYTVAHFFMSIRAPFPPLALCAGNGYIQRMACIDGGGTCSI